MWNCFFDFGEETGKKKKTVLDVKLCLMCVCQVNLSKGKLYCTQPVTVIYTDIYLCILCCFLTAEKGMAVSSVTDCVKKAYMIYKSNIDCKLLNQVKLKSCHVVADFMIPTNIVLSICCPKNQFNDVVWWNLRFIALQTRRITICSSRICTSGCVLCSVSYVKSCTQPSSIYLNKKVSQKQKQKVVFIMLYWRSS